MPGRRRGSTATPTSLDDLLADLPVPSVPLSEPKIQIGPVGGTWGADQKDWVKSTGRWGR